MLVKIGKGIELDVDTSRLGFSNLTPVGESIVYLGLRNRLMDSHASVTTDEEDYVEKSQAAAEKVLAALYAGEVRTVGTREGDPVRAEAKRLAVAAVKAAIRKAGKVKLADVDAKAINAKASEIMDRFMDQARKNVEDAKAIDTSDIDLGDIAA